MNSPASAEKIIPFAEAGEFFAGIRKSGRTLVQCHGTFDLVHPGHVIHLQEAKQLGDVLVVTVTDSANVSKGPGRPLFNDTLRAMSIAALECVDFVVLIPYPAATEAIRLVKPDIYCKGKEYEDASNDVTGNIRDDVAEVQAHGGEVRYIGSVVFSSTKLINQHFNYLSKELSDFCKSLANKISPGELRKVVDSFASLRVLVIGDTIFDQYAFLKVQGLTSKNRMISGRFLRQETYLGGALAVARHVKEFCEKVRFVSLLGCEPWVGDLLRGAISPAEDATIRDSEFTTVVKKRYVEPLQQGNEISKLFSVNFLNESPPAEATLEKLLLTIEDEICNCDVVLLADFGHGMMQKAVRDLVQEKAPFLMLNCQTNSNNHGFNIINRQYSRADAFSLDLQEMMLCCGLRNPDCESELAALTKSFGASYSWLTRGNVMTIGMAKDQSMVHIPPLVTDVTDTIGAGDAFFSVAGLAAARALPIELSTFLGQLAGAQAVKIVGNQRPISKSTLLKSAMSLLNF